jgi:hypothetical protein
MARNLLLVVAAFLMARAAIPLSARASSPVPSRVLVESEELTYNVRYAFFDLGQIRVRTLNRVSEGGSVAYRTKAIIDSYPKIPFVDLHATFESLVDSTVYSRGFMGKVKDNDSWDFARYTFEYDKDRVITEVGHRDTTIEKRDTLVVNSLYQDGLSLFYYARDQLFSGREVNVPTIVKEKKVGTYINFHRTRTSVEIDLVDYPIDVIAFDGTANFVGLFGLTGDFEGWFSNDEARVPILAKMKVILGSITIELMRWKRAGWTPPRAEG